jgi:hypothetical protein
VGQLLVNAGSQGKRDPYRRAFGEVLWSNPVHFGGDAIYTLEPLQTRGERALSCEGIAGLEWVRLREVWIATDDALQTTDVCRSSDVMTTIAARGYRCPDNCGRRGAALSVRSHRSVVADRVARWPEECWDL